jgi:tetratricopeptide (TPR) repeat protein
VSRRATAWIVAALIVVGLTGLVAQRPLRAWWDDNAGNRAMLQGRPQEAVADIERGLTLEPAWALLHEDLGRALIGTQPAAALKQFEQARCGSPCEAEAGDALLALGRTDEAIEQYVRAKAVGRATESAMALARERRYAAALAIETALLGRLHDDFEDRSDLAAVYAAIGKIEADDAAAPGDAAARRGAATQAIAAFARASGLAPLNEDYLLSYGFAQLRWGSQPEARRAFERLLQLHPGQADAQAALQRMQGKPPSGS